MKPHELAAWFAIGAILFHACSHEARADPIRISETETVRLGWPSIAGVGRYESKLVYMDGTEGEPVETVAPRREFTPRKGVPFKVVARAYSGSAWGLWSDPSSEFVLCLKSDLDCAGKVGVSDFVIMVGDWGESDGRDAVE